MAVFSLSRAALSLAALIAALPGCSERRAPLGSAAPASAPPSSHALGEAPAPGGAGCSLSAVLRGAIVPAGGATRRFSIEAGQDCAARVEGGAGWIRVSDSARGQEKGDVTVILAENAEPGPRTGALLVGGQRFPLFQDGKRALVHPRLWLNPGSVEQLQGFARDDNPVYKSFKEALATATKDYDNGFLKGKWADNGGGTFSSDVSEARAEFFAFASLLATTKEARDDAARRARALLMFVIDKVSPGLKEHVPFRDPSFATHDRGRWWGESFGLTVDWIYPYLSAEDKAKIRAVFLSWSEVMLKTANAPWLIKPAERHSRREAANNYYLGHLRNLTLMSLAFDPQDDPARAPDLPRSQPGNTLESYFNEVVDHWLPPVNALWKDGGDVSGGLPAEGFMYGSAIGFLHQGLFAMYTAGKAPPEAEALLESAYWDRLLAGFLHSIAPAPKTLPSAAYLGPVYPVANYGDVLRSWAIPDWIELFASIGLYDMSTGNRARSQAARWIGLHALEGGAARLDERIAGIWPNSRATASILSFMLFDPAEPPPPDPRPPLPLTFVDRPFGHILSRTDWGPNASWFTFSCSWKSITHQSGDCGQFGLYRKGEWITTERTGYSNNGTLDATDYHNTLSIENDKLPTAAISWFEPPIVKRGSQYILGLAPGDPVFRASSGPGFVHAEADATNLYNRGGRNRDSATDIEHASRSIVWLLPDHIVLYDRATSRTAGRFKRWNLMLPGEPAVSGRSVTAKTPAGQQLFLKSLLPASAKATRSPDEEDHTAEGEVMPVRLFVEDPSKPSDVRFLHVLEAADAGSKPSPVDYLRAEGEVPFEGALVRGAAVLFPKKPLALGEFKTLSYSVPRAIKDHVITGLPAGGYDVAQKVSGGRLEVTITKGAALTADEAGGIIFATNKR